jgi:ribosomal protein S18 acetylase RimI-like enzyme
MPDVVVPVVIRDLTVADLDVLQWSGSSSHLRSVREYLERVGEGEIEYLVAAAVSDLPVGKVLIDYALDPVAGSIGQAAVLPALQSCGIGSLLVAQAEAHIRRRGRPYVKLSVEHDNPRAKALYERLGYVAYGDAPDEWDAEDATGTIVRYQTMCTLMRKQLA